jgi:hypothetical protein
MKLNFMQILAMLLSFSIVCSASAADGIKRTNTEPAQKPVSVVAPVTVLSIIPAQAEPNGKVALYGSGFGETASVFLGSVEIPVKVTSGKQAEFIVPPQMEAGLYALYLKRSDGVLGRTYNFTVQSVRPFLASLIPSKISFCAAGKDREVTAKGGNFAESVMIFFDGAVLSGAVSTPESITFSVPSVPGGLHQIMVKNSPETSSVPLTLSVETRPEIAQVNIGTEYVNFYELIITGTNFTQNSSVYVDGFQIGGRGGQDMAEREKLIYIDCSKLIYQRHPYSPVKKDFRLQVVNPGGEGSQVVTVTAP